MTRIALKLNFRYIFVHLTTLRWHTDHSLAATIWYWFFSINGVEYTTETNHEILCKYMLYPLTILFHMPITFVEVKPYQQTKVVLWECGEFLAADFFCMIAKLIKVLKFYHTLFRYYSNNMWSTSHFVVVVTYYQRLSALMLSCKKKDRHQFT